MMTVHQLADIAAEAAAIEIERGHIEGQMGVRGRSLDNTKLREVQGWDLQIALEDGSSRTYG